MIIIVIAVEVYTTKATLVLQEATPQVGIPQAIIPTALIIVEDLYITTAILTEVFIDKK